MLSIKSCGCHGGCRGRGKRFAAGVRLKAHTLLLVAALWMAAAPPVRAVERVPVWMAEANGLHNELDGESPPATRNDGRTRIDFSPRVVPESPAWIGLAAIGVYALAGELLRWRLRG